MDETLFTYSGPHSGAGAPETSRAAANAFKAKHGSWRERVYHTALGNGPTGFVDEDLVHLAGGDRQLFERSIRPRRTELANERWILDSGKRKKVGGHDCVVWVHRQFVPNAAPLREKGGRPDKLSGPVMEERNAVIAYLKNSSPGASFAKEYLEMAADRIAAGAHRE